MSTNNPGQDRKTYEVITQRDEEGNLIIPIPPVLLKQLGWNEDDDITFQHDTSGRIVLKRVQK